MHYFHFIAIGLVSLGSTITAIPANGKPQIAKRIGHTVTATFGGCTVVCWDATSGIDCDKVQCEQSQIPGPTPKPVLKDRAIITTTITPTEPVSSSIAAEQDCYVFCATKGDKAFECLLVCLGLAKPPGSLFHSLLCPP